MNNEQGQNNTATILYAVQQQQQQQQQQTTTNDEQNSLQSNQHQQQQVTVFNQYNSGAGNTQNGYGKPIDGIGQLQMAGPGNPPPINVVQHIQGNSVNRNPAEEMHLLPVGSPIQFQANPVKNTEIIQTSGICEDKTVQIQTSYQLQANRTQMQSTCQLQGNGQAMQSTVPTRCTAIPANDKQRKQYKRPTPENRNIHNEINDQLNCSRTSEINYYSTRT